MYGHCLQSKLKKWNQNANRTTKITLTGIMKLKHVIKRIVSYLYTVRSLQY